MNIRREEEITVKLNDHKIGEEKEYIYLGHLLSPEGQMAKIKRIQIGWANFRKYKAIMMNKKMPIENKS
jgi:hypothetical protein